MPRIQPPLELRSTRRHDAPSHSEQNNINRLLELSPKCATIRVYQREMHPIATR